LSKLNLSRKLSDSQGGKNRISAAIILIDYYIAMSKNDFIDVILQAEYPGCSKLGFSKMGKQDMKPIYLDDWTAYSNWLNCNRHYLV